MTSLELPNHAFLVEPLNFIALCYEIKTKVQLFIGRVSSDQAGKDALLAEGGHTGAQVEEETDGSRSPRQSTSWGSEKVKWNGAGASVPPKPACHGVATSPGSTGWGSALC